MYHQPGEETKQVQEGGHRIKVGSSDLESRTVGAGGALWMGEKEAFSDSLH